MWEEELHRSGESLGDWIGRSFRAFIQKAWEEHACHVDFIVTCAVCRAYKTPMTDAVECPYHGHIPQVEAFDGWGRPCGYRDAKRYVCKACIAGTEFDRRKSATVRCENDRRERRD